MKTFNEWMNAEIGILPYPPIQYSTWEGWANNALQKPNTPAKKIATLRIEEYNQYVKDNIKYISLEEYMNNTVGKKSKGTWEEWLADPNQKAYQDIWYPNYQEYKDKLLAVALFSVAVPECMSNDEWPTPETEAPQSIKTPVKKVPPAPKKPIRMLN